MSKKPALDEIDLTYHPITYNSKGETKSVGKILEEAGFGKVGEIPTENRDAPIRISRGTIPGVDSDLIFVRKAQLINYGDYMGEEYVIFQRRG